MTTSPSARVLARNFRRGLNRKAAQREADTCSASDVPPQKVQISSVYHGIDFCPEVMRCLDRLRRRIEASNAAEKVTLPTPSELLASLIRQGSTPDQAVDEAISILRPELHLLKLELWVRRWNSEHIEDMLEPPHTVKNFFLLRGLAERAATQAAIEAVSAWRQRRAA